MKYWNKLVFIPERYRAKPSVSKTIPLFNHRSPSLQTRGNPCWSGSSLGAGSVQASKRPKSFWVTERNPYRITELLRGAVRVTLTAEFPRKAQDSTQTTALAQTEPAPARKMRSVGRLILCR